MTIATTIRDQLGNTTLAMLGAHTLVDMGDGLRFGFKGCRFVNVMTITLTPADLYDVTFWNIRKRGQHIDVCNEYRGVYADQLHAIIEEVTGLATKL